MPQLVFLLRFSATAFCLAATGAGATLLDKEFTPQIEASDGGDGDQYSPFRPAQCGF